MIIACKGHPAVRLRQGDRPANDGHGRVNYFGLRPGRLFGAISLGVHF